MSSFFQLYKYKVIILNFSLFMKICFSTWMNSWPLQNFKWWMISRYSPTYQLASWSKWLKPFLTNHEEPCTCLTKMRKLSVSQPWVDLLSHNHKETNCLTTMINHLSHNHGCTTCPTTMKKPLCLSTLRKPPVSQPWGITCLIAMRKLAVNYHKETTQFTQWWWNCQSQNHEETTCLIAQDWGNLLSHDFEKPTVSKTWGNSRPWGKHSSHNPKETTCLTSVKKQTLSRRISGWQMAVKKGHQLGNSKIKKAWQPLSPLPPQLDSEGLSAALAHSKFFLH